MTDDQHLDIESASMPMYFTSSVETILLFKFWHTNTAIGLFLSCLIIFVLVVFCEIFIKLCLPPPTSSRHLAEEPGTTLLGSATTRRYGSVHEQYNQEDHSRYRIIWLSFRDGCLHSLRQGIHYVIMLIVMTYNVWVAMSVLLGCAVGQFIVTFAMSSRHRRRQGDVIEEVP